MTLWSMECIEKCSLEDDTIIIIDRYYDTYLDTIIAINIGFVVSQRFHCLTFFFYRSLVSSFGDKVWCVKGFIQECQRRRMSSFRNFEMVMLRNGAMGKWYLQCQAFQVILHFVISLHYLPYQNCERKTRISFSDSALFC
jgi:hypothetical protein